MTLLARRKDLTVALVVAFFVAAAAGATQLVGGAEGICLIRSSPDGATHDVAFKPLDRDWEVLQSGINGRPAAAAVSHGTLHLLLKDPLGYLLYDLRTGRVSPGLNPKDPRWPTSAAAAAMCEITGVVEPNESAPAVVAIVPTTTLGGKRQASPATQPARAASQPALRRASLVQLSLFAASNGDWQYVTAYAAPVALGDQGQVFAAAMGNALFVLADDPQSSLPHLAAYSAGRWRQVRINDWPEQGQAVGMVTILDQLVIVVAEPLQQVAGKPANSWRLHLATYQPDSQTFTFQSVALAGGQGQWNLPALPLAARLGDRIALLWPSGQRWNLATCGPSAQLMPPSEADPFGATLAETGSRKVLDSFQWALAIGIIVLIPMLRSQLRTGPFAPPASARPASLVKRLLAGLIDLFPCSMAAGAVFHIEPVPFEKMMQMAQTDAFPASYAYAYLTMLLLYTAYGIVMEQRFGATLGKMVFKLRVIGSDGMKPALRAVLLRNLLRIVEIALPPGLPILLLLPLFNRNRQRLGDWLARTAVIQLPFQPEPPVQAKPPDPPPDR